MLGKVVWFSAQKGFGFILIKGEQYFVHFSEIISDSKYKTLRENQLVEVESIGENDKGKFAINVKAINPEPIKTKEYQEEE